VYSIGIAAQFLGVCIKTVRRWEKKKMITCSRTLGGHRRFSLVEINRILSNSSESRKTHHEGHENQCALYGRVSSHKQKARGDLTRQVDQLKAHAARQNYAVHSVYTDVGSGLNTNRKGLWRLMRDCQSGKFSTIFINFKDRLTRFGYKYLEKYVSEFGIRLVSINRLEDTSPESELVEDLVAIIHSFSGKMYRLRRKTPEKKQ
jgi:predicted site-specific integrase-resolvase